MASLDAVRYGCHEGSDPITLVLTSGPVAAWQVEVQLPRFDDWRGNGLRLTFVFNPRKFGGSYDVASHVKAMHVLYGNLSDNAEHQWTQFFDNHLGFYVQDSGLLAEVRFSSRWAGIPVRPLLFMKLI